MIKPNPGCRFASSGKRTPPRAAVAPSPTALLRVLSDSSFVADVGGATMKPAKIIKDEFGSSVAPQICVEVGSPSNTAEEIAMKRRLYLRKGAVEFW
jgi:Uma2 family endonuclease